jgi:hypothetical protein
MQSGGSMTTSPTTPSGYFDPHNTDWFPKPPSLYQEGPPAVSALAVQQQQQLDMQYEQVGPFGGSSSDQPPHLSRCDYECSQLCDRVVGTSIEPLHVSQHSLAPTYRVDDFRRFVSDQLLAASHPSPSMDPSYEEQPVYQRSTQDRINPYAQEYEHHASFDMAGNYTLSAATETIHQQPPAFNPSSSSLAGACPIIRLPSISLAPAPRQHINASVHARSRDCIDQYSHADEAFAPASALAQETAAPMIARIVPSQHAATPSHLAAAPAVFELSSRHRTWAKGGSGEHGPVEQIGRCQSPHVTVSTHSPHPSAQRALIDVLYPFRRAMFTCRRVRLTMCQQLLHSQRRQRHNILSATKRASPSTHATSSRSSTHAPTATTRTRRPSATTRVRARNRRRGSRSKLPIPRTRRPSRRRCPSTGVCGGRPTRARCSWSGFASRLPLLQPLLRNRRQGLCLLDSRMHLRRRHHLRRPLVSGRGRSQRSLATFVGAARSPAARRGRGRAMRLASKYSYLPFMFFYERQEMASDWV